MSLSSSDNPSITGHQVTLTATVTPNPGGGTVDFSDPGPTIPGCGAVAVNSSTGTATCKVTYNSTGSYPVQASYSGFAFYTGSQSPVLTQVVTTQVVTAPGQPKPTGTTTRLGASADPVVVGQRITYTAKVSSAPDGGSVRFLADGKTIARCGAVPVSAATGTSRCRATHAKPGSYGIQAVYSGDSRFTSSQSPVVIETVRSSVTLRGSPTGRSGVVSFTVHCAARSGGCRVTGTLTTAVTLHGHTVTALSASTNHKHHHTVTVGARTVSVSAGKTVTIRAKLNATGRALLAAHNELPVTLTISLTVEGQHSTVAIVKLTVSRLGGRGP